MNFKRKTCFIERGYLACPESLKSLYINVVLEGESKKEIDINSFKKAIETLSNFNPAMRLVVKGYLNFTYLVDSGCPPPFRIIERSSWDGMNSDTMDFLKNSCNDFKKGPLAEVIYIKGLPTRIVFRVHHILMDGKGLYLWIEDLFRILRGEKPISFYSKDCEYNLIKQYKVGRRKAFKRDSISLTGKPEGTTQLKPRFIRKTIKLEKKISNFTGHIVVLLASIAREYLNGNFYVALTVDLRYRADNIKTTRNFTASFI
jgi:hypothetical protein